MELQWYIVFGVIGVISAWMGRYWILPILIRGCSVCIRKVLSDELDKMEQEEEKIIEKMMNPKVLVDEESGELYFDGQISPSKRRKLEEDNSSSEEDEKKSEYDIENDRKFSIRSDRKLSERKLSERKLSFEFIDESPKRKKHVCRNPFKLARIKQAKAEREAFQAAILKSVRIPTKAEKIHAGIHNFKSKFIYNVEAEVGWHLTRDQVLCMSKETRENLYKMPTSSFFHRISKRNKNKAKPDYQPEWDAATSVDGDTWKLKRKHAKLWRLKTVIGMMDDPPTICRKDSKRIDKKIFNFDDPNVANEFLGINREASETETSSEDLSRDDIARSISGFSSDKV
jgi:hypothetical protein